MTIRSIKFDQSGNWLVSGSEDSKMRIFFFQEGGSTKGEGLWKKVYEVEHPSRVRSVDFGFGPAAERVVTGCLDGKARIFELSKLRECMTIVPEEEAGASSDQVGADDRPLRARSTYTVSDSSSGVAEHVIDHGKVRVYAVAFGAGGARVATGDSEGTVRIVDAASGTVQMSIECHSLIYDVAFDAWGAHVAAGCEVPVHASTHAHTHALTHARMHAHMTDLHTYVHCRSKLSVNRLS